MAISYESLRISTFEFNYITEFKIENDVNNHAIMKISGLVDEEINDMFLHYTTEQTPIMAYYLKNDEEYEVLFNGVISKIKVKSFGNEYKMTVECKSNSYYMDIYKCQRTFQNVSMTTHQLINEVMSSYPSLSYDISIKDEAIGEFTLQYNETDWEFLKRILSRYNASIFVIPSSDNMELSFGIPEGVVEIGKGKIDLEEAELEEELNLSETQYIGKPKNFSESSNLSTFGILGQKNMTVGPKGIGDLIEDKKLFAQVIKDDKEVAEPENKIKSGYISNNNLIKKDKLKIEQKVYPGQVKTIESKSNVKDFEIYTVIKDLESYNEAMKYGDVNVSETDYITYKVKSEEILYLGEGFEFLKRNLYVKKAVHILSDGIVKSSYELKAKTGIRTNKMYNKNLIGISLFGTIAEVSRDRVRVNLEIESQKDKSELYWFPYASVASSPDGGGWYCMPEIGERIRLNIPAKDESKAFVINAIDSQDISSASEGDRMTDPSQKSLKTDAGQEVKFTPNGVVIESNGGEAAMNLNNDGTVTVNGQKSVTISCQEALQIRAEKEIHISAKEGVEMSTESGATLKMKKSGKIEVSGKRILNNCQGE